MDCYVACYISTLAGCVSTGSSSAQMCMLVAHNIDSTFTASHACASHTHIGIGQSRNIVQ